jgi:hypothetical protein
MRKKDSKSKIVEDRLVRKFIHMMPGFPKLFDKLIQRVERFDGTAPQTFITDIRNDCHTFAQKLQGRERRIGRFLRFLIGKLAVRMQVKLFTSQLIEMTKQAAATDDRYSLLLKLMHKADEKVPFAGLIVSMFYADPEKMLVPQSVPLQLLRRAEKLRGEERAIVMLDALAKTVEFVYKPYIHVIWMLSYIKEGKRPPQPPELGDMIKVAAEQLADYPGLVERDAVWMRNSAVHNLPAYIPEEDSLWLWDRKHPRKKIGVEELLIMVQRMYLISANTIQRVGQLYLFREFYLESGLGAMLLESSPEIFADDENRLAAAEQRMKEHANLLFEPLVKFLEPQNLMDCAL